MDQKKTAGERCFSTRICTVKFDRVPVGDFSTDIKGACTRGGSIGKDTPGQTSFLRVLVFSSSSMPDFVSVCVRAGVWLQLTHGYLMKDFGGLICQTEFILILWIIVCFI